MKLLPTLLILMVSTAHADWINPQGQHRSELPERITHTDGAVTIRPTWATLYAEGWREATGTVVTVVTTNSIPLDAQLLMVEYAAAINEVFASTNAHLIYDRDQVAVAVGTSTNLTRGEKLDFLDMEDRLRAAFGAEDLRGLPYGMSEIVTTNASTRWEAVE